MVMGIEALDVFCCDSGSELALEKPFWTTGSHMSATHLVMVCVLQDLDAGRVDEHRRSLPSSQPRTAGLLAYRGTTCAR